MRSSSQGLRYRPDTLNQRRNRVKPTLSHSHGRPTRTALGDTLLRTGVGECMAQYGEIFQGQIEDSDHRLRRCLVSLPCPVLSSKAIFIPSLGEDITVSPLHKLKAKQSV